MKKLLSLPPNLVGCFHQLEHVDTKEWFCTSDPVNAKLGSGGGTAWLLQACQQAGAPADTFDHGPAADTRIVLQSCRQSRPSRG